MSHGSWKDLIKACNEGNESLVACYLKSGVDPNFQHPEYLTTALIETIRAGNLSLVKFLIENGGSDPNLPEELTGMTPIEVSMEEKKFDIIDFFYQRKIGSAEQYVKLILITDASRSGKGTGFAIAKRFLALGHHVVITCPTDTVGEATVKSLIDETGNSKVDYVMGELTSVALVHDLIKQFRKKFAFLDIMVLNSEVWLSEKMINVDGLEMTFMVNYLASYMLCHGLLSCLQHKGAAAEGVRGRSRIIRFSSPIHAFGSARIDKTPRGLDFGCLNTYASVNQCILCFMKYFCSSQAIVAQTKNATRSVTINSVQPRFFWTGPGCSGMSALGLLQQCLQRIWDDTDGVGEIIEWMALDPDLENTTGCFFWQKKKQHISKDEILEEKMQKEWTTWTESFLKPYQPQLLEIPDFLSNASR